MENTFKELISYAVKNKCSDVHLELIDELIITLRSSKGIREYKNKISKELFNYIAFLSNLDIGNYVVPQSGSFSFYLHDSDLDFRFSCICNKSKKSGVLRILGNHTVLAISDLTYEKNIVKEFNEWCLYKQGLIIFSGPTGSGKTTSVNALLTKIAKSKIRRIITLEDPIEIVSNDYLQFEINDKIGFNYENGIKSLLRHDPDVIMIGEIRDEYTAKMCIQAALTGHLVISTIHAKNALEVLHRFKDYSIDSIDLKQVLKGITSQRIYDKKDNKEKICIYEILSKEELVYSVKNFSYSKEHKDIYSKIEKAILKNHISEKEAKADLLSK